jgi:hypothetical protein
MKSEAAIQNDVRLEASKLGIYLWRNNVGAHKTDTGFIRYGLANDSAATNKTMKSADLIGIRPLVITLDHVGMTVGQFVSREIKQEGWAFRGTERELSQERWAKLIASLGGDAAFASGVGTFNTCLRGQ